MAWVHGATKSRPTCSLCCTLRAYCVRKVCDECNLIFLAQVEQHVVDGQQKTLLVHRKGSTRAFPPHHPLIPVDYQFIGRCTARCTGRPACLLSAVSAVYRPGL
jgi:hypothetical protein